jgi:hypothetical protein
MPIFYDFYVFMNVFFHLNNQYLIFFFITGGSTFHGTTYVFNLSRQ